MVRDPDTGRRVSRSNPPELWQQAEAPDLAIIDAATWEAAQGHKASRATGQARQEPYRRRKRLLTGLLRCGHCGGGMSAHDRNGEAVRVRCTTERESGTCTNRRRYRLDKIERVVIEGVAERLSNPAALEEYIDGWQAERRAETKARAQLERAVADAEAKISRMARMLVDGRVPEDFFDAEMPKARAELAALQARLEAAPSPQVVAPHPAALAAYSDVLARLAPILSSLDPARDRELVDAFRAMIDRVVIHDTPEGGVEAEVIGHLGPLVGGRVVPPAPLLGTGGVAEVRFPPFPPMTWGRFLCYGTAA